MKRILVTGNGGYIGPVLCETLISRGYDVRGLDTDYYRGCELCPMPQVHRQFVKDIRDVSPLDFEEVDTLIHLAALSNDPLGELAPSLTDDINLGGTLKVARSAQAAGVKRFIYASSQSMYGIATANKELDEDDSEKRPVTAYARTKWEAECELMRMHSDNFVVVCFRPATVFGVAPRLRCDIVYNNFVACAYTTGRIEIKSDGSPWRPVVHVRDVCAAFTAGVEAPVGIVGGRSFNVGILGGNYTVRELAEAAQRVVPGTELAFTGEHGSDSRTYKVSFSRILTELRAFYQPEWDLIRGGRELVEFFQKVSFSEQHFRGKSCTRLSQIRSLLAEGYLSKDLFWNRSGIL